MSVSEQELFGLMAVAQEQQQAAAVALERLEALSAGWGDERSAQGSAAPPPMAW